MNTMKKISLKVAKAVEKAGYSFSYEVNEYFTQYFPTYIEIWLWLWREKKAMLIVDGFELGMAEVVIYLQNSIYNTNHIANDPEEAIIAAIDYLVDENLIK